MAYKPSDRAKGGEESIEPNVTPIMNLMVVLIPMLLQVAAFVQLALLEYAPPPIDEGGGTSGEQEQEQPDSLIDDRPLLNLTLNVTEEAFQVSMKGATKGENFMEIPVVSPGNYNFDGLRDSLVHIRQEIIGDPLDTLRDADPETGEEVVSFKWQFKDGDNLKIAAKGDIPWQVIVGILDAAREFEDSDGVTKPLYAQPIMGQMQ